MRRRGGAEKTEILVRLSNGRSLLLLAAFLVVSLVFLGSPARFAAPANLAVGGAASAVEDSVQASILASTDSVADRGLYYSAYRVKPGDMVGAIAESYDVSVDSIISFNNIQNTRALRPGQILKVPSMAGILCVAKAGDTAESLATSYGIAANEIIEANGLLQNELPAGKIVFLPDATLPSSQLREINGDLFHWPVRGWVTSRYGWRSDPFTGTRSFHDGLDIGVGLGTPIGAAMEGRVVETGYSSSFGNYVLLAHHTGWMSFYGHMNSYVVKSGQWVNIGQRIGYVGNTGYSTGPHLHFSVFKNGRTMNPTVVLH
jgi:murein DD-endopeptidase MepM/ murein hydrolase activator NlpD